MRPLRRLRHRLADALPDARPRAVVAALLTASVAISVSGVTAAVGMPTDERAVVESAGPIVDHPIPPIVPVLVPDAQEPTVETPANETAAAVEDATATETAQPACTSRIEVTYAEVVGFDALLADPAGTVETVEDCG